MIDVEALVFDYPSGRALHGVGFVVRQGAAVVLLGPEGAGKTTLLRCIAALDRPERGRISVVGLDTERDPRGVHAAVGYVPRSWGLYDRLSVRRCLTYAARSRGVGEGEAPAAVEATAAAVGLSDRLETMAGALPPLRRQRLAIGQAVVHRPRVLLMDEPGAALGATARAALAALIQSFARGGMTVLISARHLSEVQDGCSERLVLEAGRVVGDGVTRLAGSAGAGEGAPMDIAP